MSVTADFASRTAGVGPDHLDATARLRATSYIIDAIGCILAGMNSAEASVLLRAAPSLAGSGPAALLGTGLSLDPAGAALVNATAGHAYDYDDSSPPMIGHPSVPMVSAMLALCAQRNVSGLTFITAYVAGLEMAAGLGRLLNPDHYARGWHATCTLGTLGATAAAASILGLDADGQRHAIGIAASSSGGIRKNFGSMVKPLHAGFAARNGVIAGSLAAAGYTADTAALDGPNGFIDVFGAIGEVASLAPSGTLEINRSGVGIKRYPCCGCTHTALDLLLRLRAQHNISPTAVRSIDCTMNGLVPDILVHHRPASHAQAKFSMEYCLAVAMLDGDCGLAQFDTERVKRADVQSLLTRVTTRVDDDLVYRNGVYPAQVTITLADGQQYSAVGEEAAGHPDHPLSIDALRLKFIACAARRLGQDGADALFETLLALDRLPDIQRIISLSTKAGTPT